MLARDLTILVNLIQESTEVYRFQVGFYQDASTLLGPYVWTILHVWVHLNSYVDIDISVDNSNVWLYHSE